MGVADVPPPSTLPWVENTSNMWLNADSELTRVNKTKFRKMGKMNEQEGNDAQEI